MIDSDGVTRIRSFESVARETRCGGGNTVPGYVLWFRQEVWPDLSGTGLRDGQSVPVGSKVFRMEREGGTDGCAGTESLDLEEASELEYALAHAGDANPGLSRRAIDSAQAGFWNSLPVIAHFDFDVMPGTGKANGCR